MHLHFQKHQVYYKTDEFYRILSYQKVITADKEQYLHYIKIRAIRHFTEDNFSAAVIDLLKAFYYNTIANEYTVALEHLEQFREKLKMSQFFKMMDHIILKRKSFVWFKTIRRSFKTLQRAIIPDYINHPLDHARLTTAGAYRALCYVKLNDKKELLKK